MVRRCAWSEPWRLALEQRLEFQNGLLQFAALEERETEIQAQAGHRGIHRQGLAVKRHGLLVVFLARFQQAQVSVRLRIGGMSLQENAPCGLSLDILSLLLQGQRGLPLALRRRGLPQADCGSHGQTQADSQSHNPIHSHPLSIINGLAMAAGKLEHDAKKRARQAWPAALRLKVTS